jgi:hypothetical protein
MAPERQDARTGTGRQANTNTNDQGKPTIRRRSGPGSRPRQYPLLRLERDEVLRAAKFGAMTDRHFKYDTRVAYRCPCEACARWRASRVVA